MNRHCHREDWRGGLVEVGPSYTSVSADSQSSWAHHLSSPTHALHDFSKQKKKKRICLHRPQIQPLSRKHTYWSQQYSILRNGPDIHWGMTSARWGWFNSQGKWWCRLWGVETTRHTFLSRGESVSAQTPVERLIDLRSHLFHPCHQEGSRVPGHT